MAAVLKLWTRVYTPIPLIVLQHDTSLRSARTQRNTAIVGNQKNARTRFCTVYELTRNGLKKQLYIKINLLFTLFQRQAKLQIKFLENLNINRNKIKCMCIILILLTVVCIYGKKKKKKRRSKLHFFRFSTLVNIYFILQITLYFVFR